MALTVKKLDPIQGDLIVNDHPITGLTSSTPLSVATPYDPGNFQHYNPMPWDPTSRGGMNIFADFAQDPGNLLNQAAIGIRGQLNGVPQVAVDNQNKYLDMLVAHGKMSAAEANTRKAANQNLGSQNTAAIQSGERQYGTKFDQSSGVESLLNTAGLIDSGAGAFKSLLGRSSAEKVAIAAPERVAPTVPVPEPVTPRVAEQPTTTPIPVVTAPVKGAKVAESVPQPVPTGSPKTGIDEIDKAVQDMHDHYNNAPQFEQGSLWDMQQMAQGKAAAGNRMANNLGKSIEKNLTEDERHAVYDSLQGVENKNLTPRAAKVADALRPLQETAHGIRAAIKPTVGKVTEYAPRIVRGTLGNAVRTAASGVKAKLKSLANLGSLESKFSNARQNAKFVDEQGNAIYGTQNKLGLTQKNGENRFEDANGTAYKQTTSNTHELKANTGVDYIHDISPVQSIYHGDTSRLHVRSAAIDELKTNPNSHGLFTADQVEANGLHDQMKEVSVNGLTYENGKNYWASAKDAKQLERSRLFGRPDTRTVVGKAYDAVSSAATQFIVLNPIFHGANQLVQSMIAAGNFRGLGMGWIRLAKGVGHITEEDALHYLDNGGHIPSYGSDVQNMLSRATLGITKISSKGMAGIEYRLRVGLYKASLDSGMTPKQAIKNIDQFLGDTHQMSQATRRVTLFAHYFKTMVKAPLTQLRHPVENAGSIVNTAAVAGILFGMTEGYKAFTGNQDAYVRMPGEIGMIKEGVKAVGEVATGQIPSVLTNHINPVAKEIVQQAIPDGGLDFFTGKKVDQGGGIADRGTHAFNSLVAPSQPTSQVTEGKRTGAEIATNQLGLYTPHAKGYETTTNPNLDLLNTQDSLRGQGNGKAGQTAYFDGVKAAKGSVPKGDTQTADDLNSFLDHSHDPKTGQTIQMSPRESINNSGSLATNDTLRGIVQKMEQSQPSHDPIWDLPDDKLKTLMQYRGQFTGDAGKTFLKGQQTDANGGNWIDDVTKKSQDYYNGIKRPPGLPPLKNGPEFPKFDTATQKLLDTYNTADTATKRTMMQSYSGELSGAFNQIAQYTNAMRRAEGAPEKNDYPVADKATQDAMNAYNALPQHDGSKGGNASRYAWSQANPGAYSLIQSYLTKATLNSLIKEAGQAQFKGSEPSAKLLGDIYNMGQYDIQKTKDASGNAQYAIGSSSSSSSSGSSSKSRTIRAYRGRSNIDKPDKVRVKSVSVRSGKIKMGKRLSTSSHRGPKVTLKKSKV